MPWRPGRVVTLIEDLEACCAGMAYRIDPTLSSTVLARLDHREQGGYDQLQIPIHFSATETVTGITYYANSTNSSFLGTRPSTVSRNKLSIPQDPVDPTQNIFWNWITALQSINLALAQDPDNHVAAIAIAVRRLLAT